MCERRCDKIVCVHASSPVLPISLPSSIAFFLPSILSHSPLTHAPTHRRIEAVQEASEAYKRFLAEYDYEKEEDETKLDSLLNERNQSAAALRTQLLLIRCKLLARYLSPARLPSSSAAHRSSGHPAEAREAPRAPSQGLAPLPATAARPVKEEPERFEYRLSVEDDDDWTGSRKMSPGGAESSGDSAADSSMEYPRSGMKPEREMHDPYACLFSDDEVEL